VTSPTFVLVNQYCGRLPVYHLDAYRTSLTDLGLEEMLHGDG
jgi:tRNA threonylcarbamoyladenosine biosynthesis protein TsaE